MFQIDYYLSQAHGPKRLVADFEFWKTQKATQVKAHELKIFPQFRVKCNLQQIYMGKAKTSLVKGNLLC